MKFGLIAFTGMMLVIALAIPGKAGFDLSISNISVNGTGGAFTVFATATGNSEAVSSYTLRLNLTNTSAGELPVTFTEGGTAAGFAYQDFIPNNTVAALNGNFLADSVGFSGARTGQPALTFNLGNPTAVGTFSFTTANGFNAGDYVDVGIVVGAFDSQFANAAFASIPLNVIGGTNQAGNNPIIATSTRIAAAVPEPSALGVVSLIGFGLAMRRKRKA